MIPSGKLFTVVPLLLLTFSLFATADWEQAAELRKNDDWPGAEKLLKKYSSPANFDQLPPAEKADFLRGLLELAHIRALKEDVSGALRLLNWAESNKDDYLRAVSCVKYAEILLDLDEIERAQGYLKNADELIAGRATEKETGAAIGQGGAQADTGGAWRELRAEAEATKAEIEAEALKKKFGSTYASYVKLRRMQKIAKRAKTPRYWNEAMRLAGEIEETDPASQFAAAAGYLKGELWADALHPDSAPKDIKGAKNYLEKFVKQQPDGLYRGEALMLLGKISLELEWNAKDAEKYYTAALDYFRKAREKRDALSLYAPVSEDLKEQIAPTQKPTTFNRWKRTVYHDEDPLKLYNIATAPAWYINNKEKNCLIMAGFFRYLAEQYEEASSLWRKAGELDAELMNVNAGGTPTTLSRLQAACTNKKMVFSGEERKKIGNDFKLRIAYAELLFGQEKFEDARKHFIDISENSESSKYDKAAGLIGAGYCDSQLLQTANRDILMKSQENTWRKALKLATGTPLERHAMWMSISTLMRSTTTEKDALPVLEAFLKKYPNDEKKNAAWFCIAAVNLGENNEEASRIYRRLRNEIPNSHQVKELERMFEFMKVEPATGRKIQSK